LGQYPVFMIVALWPLAYALAYPYGVRLPASQWMYGFHVEPGALSFATSALYLCALIGLAFTVGRLSIRRYSLR
jgi:hypothetical protein